MRALRQHVLEAMNGVGLESEWVWLAVTIIGFGLCTFLPIWVKDETWRRMINWVILIPVSLILIFYVYPFGLEVFRRLALSP